MPEANDEVVFDMPRSSTRLHRLTDDDRGDNSPNAGGLQGWFAKNVANISAVTFVMFLAYLIVNVMLDRDRANEERINRLIEKSEERETRAWQQRQHDREVAMKHADDAVKLISASITANTMEVGKMTAAITKLVETRQQ